MFEKKRFLLVISLLVATGLLSLFLQIRAGGREGRASLPRSLPLEVSGWQGSPFSAAMPREVEPDDYVLRFYAQGDGRQIGLLALYSRISNYHPPALCYQGSGHHLTEIPGITSSSGRIRLAGLMGKRETNAILVYHGFYINGRIIPDGIGRKLYEVKEKLVRGTIDQYFFEVTANADNGDLPSAVSRLKRFLDDLEPYLLSPKDEEG